MTEYLKKKGLDLAQKDTCGDTPVHYAVQKQCIPVVRYLFSQRINPNIVGARGLTPLHLASQGGNFKLCKLLHKYGADLNYVDEEKLGALHHSAMCGHPQVCEWLIKNGVDVNSQCEITGQTPLFFAALHDHYLVCEILVKLGGSLFHEDRMGRQPIHLAIAANRIRICRIFLKKTFHLQSKPDFQMFLEQNRVFMCERLIDIGENVNITFKNGETPLEIAVKTGSFALVSMLISNGAVITKSVLKLSRTCEDSRIYNYLQKCVSTAISIHSMYHTCIPHDLSDSFLIKQSFLASHLHKIEAFSSNVDKTECERLISEIPGALMILRSRCIRNTSDTSSWTSVQDLQYTLRRAVHHCDHAPLAKMAPLSWDAVYDSRSNHNINCLLEQLYFQRNLEQISLLPKKGLLIPFDPVFNLNTLSPLSQRCFRFIVRTGFYGEPIHIPDDSPSHVIEKLLQDRLTNLLEFWKLGIGSVDHRDSEQWTALMFACKFQLEDIVGFLLNHGADLHALNRDGNQALHFAASVGSTQICRILLMRGADINRRGKNGLTPLHYAAGLGQIDTIRLLIEHGATVDSCDTQAWQPLHYSAHFGRTTACKYLLKQAHAQQTSLSPLQTPFYLSLASGHIPTSKLLYRPHKHNLSLLNQLLHRVAQQGYHEACTFLINHGAQVDYFDSLNRSALFLATENGHFEACRVLCEARANVHASDKGRIQPLHVAAEQGTVSICELLMDHSANVDCRTITGESPLIIAARSGQLSVCELLLQAGVVISAVDNLNRTALHYAAMNGHRAVCELLQKHRCDVSIQDFRGKNAFDCIDDETHRARFYQICIELAEEDETS